MINTYKGSQGAFILKFPFELTKNAEQAQYLKGNIYYIYPEYIVGFIPIKENGVMGEFIKNPNYNLTNDKGRI